MEDRHEDLGKSVFTLPESEKTLQLFPSMSANVGGQRFTNMKPLCMSVNSRLLLTFPFSSQLPPTSPYSSLLFPTPPYSSLLSSKLELSGSHAPQCAYAGQAWSIPKSEPSCFATNVNKLSSLLCRKFPQLRCNSRNGIPGRSEFRSISIVFKPDVQTCTWVLGSNLSIHPSLHSSLHSAFCTSIYHPTTGANSFFLVVQVLMHFHLVSCPSYLYSVGVSSSWFLLTLFSSCRLQTLNISSAVYRYCCLSPKLSSLSILPVHRVFTNLLLFIINKST